MFASTATDLAPGRTQASTQCAVCSFTLWHPISTLGVSTLGLYDDARFPGRTLVVLNEHHDHLDEVPPALAAAFVSDVQRVAGVLRGLGASRANVAILGNQEPHVHAHVIPRRAHAEPLPHRSPWDDPRPREPLPPAEASSWIHTLRDHLARVHQPTESLDQELL